MGKSASILETTYLFFAWLGEGVLSCPNKAFYCVLAFICILMPILAILTAIALLCASYRRAYH